MWSWFGKQSDKTPLLSKDKQKEKESTKNKKALLKTIENAEDYFKEIQEWFSFNNVEGRYHAGSIDTYCKMLRAAANDFVDLESDIMSDKELDDRIEAFIKNIDLFEKTALHYMKSFKSKSGDKAYDYFIEKFKERVNEVKVNINLIKGEIKEFNAPQQIEVDEKAVSASGYGSSESAGHVFSGEAIAKAEQIPSRSFSLSFPSVKFVQQPKRPATSMGYHPLSDQGVEMKDMSSSSSRATKR